MSYLLCTNKQQFWFISWGNCAIKTLGSLKNVSVLVRWQEKKKRQHIILFYYLDTFEFPILESLDFLLWYQCL